MVKTLSLVLLIIVVLFSNHDASSQVWKPPFTVNVAANGTEYVHLWNVPQHGPEHGSDSGYSRMAFESMWVYVDSGREYTEYSYGDTASVKSTYSFDNDTLKFARLDIATGPTPHKDTSIVRIVFSHRKDSVLYLYFHRGVWDFDMGTAEQRALTFTAANFEVDDTSLYSSDSSVQGHNASLIYYHSSAEYAISPQYPQYGWFSETYFDLNSIDLSGIFRPMRLSKGVARVSTASEGQQGMSALETDRGFRINCMPTTFEREIEIFSMCGVNVCTRQLPAGNSESVVAGLRPGLYLVRLGDAVTKVVVRD